MQIVVGKIDVGLFHYLVNDQTCMEFPWQAQAPKLNPPVSSRILTTSVGYMKGLRQICRPVASGRQDSSTDPSRLLNPDMLITSHSHEVMLPEKKVDASLSNLPEVALRNLKRFWSCIGFCDNRMSVVTLEPEI